MINILAIIQILIFIWYILYIKKNYGILSSISESWYKLKEKNKQALFNVFASGVGIPMMFYGLLDTISFNSTILFALSGLFLWVVSTASDYKQKMANKVHYVGATLSIICGFIGIIIQFNSWWPLIGFILSAVVLKRIKIKNYTWWVEILAFGFIITRLIII